MSDLYNEMITFHLKKPNDTPLIFVELKTENILRSNNVSCKNCLTKSLTFISVL